MKKIVVTLLIAVSFNISAQNSKVFSSSYAHENKKEYAEAIKDIEGIDSGNNYYSKVRLGWLYYLNGNNAKSVEYYKAAITIKPKAIEPLLGIAGPLYTLQKWTELKGIYTKILSIDPNNTTALYRLALTNYYAKDYPTAEAQAAKMLTMYPFDFDTNLLMGGIKLSLGKISEAKGFYETALLAKPDDKTALETLQSLK